MPLSGPRQKTKLFKRVASLSSIPAYGRIKSYQQRIKEKPEQATNSKSVDGRKRAKARGLIVNMVSGAVVSTFISCGSTTTREMTTSTTNNKSEARGQCEQHGLISRDSSRQSFGARDHGSLSPNLLNALTSHCFAVHTHPFLCVWNHCALATYIGVKSSVCDGHTS